jgi:hypothetical protein
MSEDKYDKTPIQYDSIIISEFDRYAADCGMKIGDHKLLCKVFDAQDKNIQLILNAAYEFHALNIAGTVREMLGEHKEEIRDMLNANHTEVLGKIEGLEKRFEDHKCVFNEFRRDEFTPLKETVDKMQKELHIVKKKNTWAVIILRGIGWVLLGYLIIRLLHGPFIA